MSYARLCYILEEAHANHPSKSKPMREDYIPLISQRCKRPHARRPFPVIRLPMTADDDTKANAVAVQWRLANQEMDSNIAFEHYISFLLLMIPEIQGDIENCIRNLGHDLVYNDYPTYFVYEECLADGETIPMNLKQAMVYLGVSLLIPFKNINSENYTGYFTRGIAALSNMVGVEVATMGMPFSVDKCIHFKSKMNQFDPVRKRIVRFLISETTSSEVLMNIVSRYVLQMIAWAEMTAFYFVLEALVACVSPVLLCMELEHEVSKYFDIADKVFSTDHPSLYKYLASDRVLIPMDESQFPILYAVAHRVLAGQHTSVTQLFGPTNVNPNIVTKYVNLHNAYINRTFRITKKVERFVPELIDPDVRELAMQMKTHNLTYDELIGLRTYLDRGEPPAAASKVRDSHGGEG